MEKIIIDCDPGVDDAVALMMALAAGEQLEVCGITTVAGNLPLPAVTRNALRILSFLQREDIPVFAGCSRAIFPGPARLSSVHGADGLGNSGLPESELRPAQQHAVDFIIDTVLAAAGEITLCVLGPMTNIALALIKAPEIAPQIKQIVVMGGAVFCPGNTTPAAEFNFACDPHAAEVVLAAGVPLTLFGLDVTSKALLTAPRIEALRQSDSASCQLAAVMLADYGAADPCLHDPCVIAGLLDPDCFTGIPAWVSVDCTPGINYGRSVGFVSERHLAGRQPNVKVITGVDDQRLFRLLMDLLSR